MAITKTNKDKLAQAFNSHFTDSKQDLVARFKEDDEAVLDEIVSSSLRENGFPSDANYLNTKYDLEITSNIEPSEWADDFIEHEQLDNDDEVLSMVDNEAKQQYYILNDRLDAISFNVTPQVEVSEWLEENGSEEYISRAMAKHYEPIVFADEVLTVNKNSYVMEQVKQALIDDGFPESVNPSDVNFSLGNLQLTKSFDDLATEKIDEVYQYNTVSDYIDTQFYTDLEETNAYTFDVDILDDPEDYK